MNKEELKEVINECLKPIIDAIAQSTEITINSCCSKSVDVDKVINELTEKINKQNIN